MKNSLFKLLPFLVFFLFTAFYVKQVFYKDFLFSTEEKGLLNYNFANYRFQHIWNFSENFGSITPSYLSTLSLGTFWKISGGLHLSLTQTQRLFYFLLIFFTVTFTYLSFVYINRDKFLSFILSLLYITSYNYFALLDTSPKLFHFLIMPLGLFFWHQYYSSKKAIYLIIHFLLITSVLSISINPPQMLGSYSFIFLYLGIFYTSRKNIKYVILFLFPYVINLLFVFFTNKIVFSYSGGLMYFDPLKIAWTSTDANLADIFRLFGSWWDYASSADGLPYNHLVSYYHSTTGKIITYVPLLLAIYLTAKNKVKKDNGAVKTLLLFLIFVIFAKGKTPPLNFIFEYLYNFNYFKIFREPWAKFIPNVNFTLLMILAYASTNVSSQTRKKILLLLSIVLIFYTIPLFNKKIIDHRNIRWKILDIRIPDYWLNFYQWSKKNLADKRTLVLPYALDKSPIVHEWYPFPFRGTPEVFFLESNIVSQAYVTKEDELIISKFMSNIDPSLLAISSIDYVLFKNDVELSPENKYVLIDKIKDALDYNGVISFGKLDLYPVKKDYHTDKVRMASSLSKTTKKLDFNSLKRLSNVKHDAVIYTSDYITSTPVEAPQIKVTKRNETTYKITFQHSVTKNTALLFASTYNRGWLIYNSDSFFAKPIADQPKHYQANSFSNLWILPANIVNSNKELFLRYEPQSLFNFLKLGYLSSFGLYLILIAIINLLKHKKKIKLN